MIIFSTTDGEIQANTGVGACDRCRERKTRCQGGRPCNTCVRFGQLCSHKKPPPRGRACLTCSRRHKMCDRNKPVCGNCFQYSKVCRWSEKSISNPVPRYDFVSFARQANLAKDLKSPKCNHSGSDFNFPRRHLTPFHPRIRSNVGFA